MGVFDDKHLLQPYDGWSIEWYKQ